MWWGWLAAPGCAWLTADEVGGYFDRDGDGADAVAFGGIDCDDADNSIVRYPWFVDRDGDGAGGDTLVLGCEAEPGWSERGDDCDDDDPAKVPGTRSFADADADGHGAGPSVETCGLPEGRSLSDDDCDDADSLRSPGLPDAPRDGVDADCDGTDLDDDGDDLPDLQCGSPQRIDTSPATFEVDLASAADCSVLVLAPGEYPPVDLVGPAHVALVGDARGGVRFVPARADTVGLEVSGAVEQLVVEGVTFDGFDRGAFAFGGSTRFDLTRSSVSGDRVLHLDEGLDHLGLYGVRMLAVGEVVEGGGRIEELDWRSGRLVGGVGAGDLAACSVGTASVADLVLDGCSAVGAVLSIQASGSVDLTRVSVSDSVGDRILFVRSGGGATLTDVVIDGNVARSSVAPLLTVFEDTTGRIGIERLSILDNRHVEDGLAPGDPDLVSLGAPDGGRVATIVADHVEYGGNVLPPNGRGITVRGRQVTLSDLAMHGTEGSGLWVEGDLDLDQSTLLGWDSPLVGAPGGTTTVTRSLLDEWPAGLVRTMVADEVMIERGHLLAPCGGCLEGDFAVIRDPLQAGLTPDLHLRCDGAPGCDDVLVGGAPVGAHAEPWPYPDVDGDGLPDHWEVQFFGDRRTVAAGDDPDGDGLDNRGELLRGTYPDTRDTDGDGTSDPDDDTLGGG